MDIAVTNPFAVGRYISDKISVIVNKKRTF